MNNDTVRGKINEFAGEVQRLWGKVTKDELAEAKGNLTSIAGIIQQKYGEKKEAVMMKLEELKARFADSKDEAVDTSKAFIAKKSEDAKTTIRGDDKNRNVV